MASQGVTTTITMLIAMNDTNLVWIDEKHSRITIQNGDFQSTSIIIISTSSIAYYSINLKFRNLG